MTLATIEPSGEVRASPRLLSSASPQHVLVAADLCLLVFSANCAEVTPIVFPHTVNTFAVSPCCRWGRYLSIDSITCYLLLVICYADPVIAI